MSTLSNQGSWTTVILLEDRGRKSMEGNNVSQRKYALESLIDTGFSSCQSVNSLKDRIPSYYHISGELMEDGGQYSR